MGLKQAGGFARSPQQRQNVRVRIELRNQQRRRLFSVEIDLKNPSPVVRPPDGNGPEVYLDWDRTLDDKGQLRQCPVCGCRELFVRKDFPQVTGFVIVVLAVVVSVFMFGLGHRLWALALLGLVALADAVIYLFTGRCLVCYRCRSEFRDLPIPRGHPRWDLAIGEKYHAMSPETDADESARHRTNE